MELFIAAKDESCGPRTEPESAPVSCCGKNPLGILMMRTTLSAMVMNSTIMVSAGLSRTQVSVRRYKESTQSKTFSLAL